MQKHYKLAVGLLVSLVCVLGTGLEAAEERNERKRGRDEDPSGKRFKSREGHVMHTNPFDAELKELIDSRQLISKLIENGQSCKKVVLPIDIDFGYANYKNRAGGVFCSIDEVSSTVYFTDGNMIIYQFPLNLFMRMLDEKDFNVNDFKDQLELVPGKFCDYGDEMHGDVPKSVSEQEYFRNNAAKFIVCKLNEELFYQAFLSPAILYECFGERSNKIIYFVLYQLSIKQLEEGTRSFYNISSILFALEIEGVERFFFYDKKLEAFIEVSCIKIGSKVPGSTNLYQAVFVEEAAGEPMEA